MGCSPNNPHNKLFSTRFLLTTLILAQFLLSVVCAASVHHEPQFDEEDDKDMTRDLLLQEAAASSGPGGAGGRRRNNHRHRHDHDDSGVERRIKIYSLCSQNYVRMAPRRGKKGKLTVDAQGKEDDPYVELLFKSIDFNGTLTIQSEKTKEYLCYNRKGRLITKKNGRRKKMCHFTERPAYHHTQFQSKGNRKFYLGFRKSKGKPLQGDKWTKSSRWRKCTRFLTHNQTTQKFIEGGMTDEYQPFQKFPSIHTS